MSMEEISTIPEDIRVMMTQLRVELKNIQDSFDNPTLTCTGSAEL